MEILKINACPTCSSDEFHAGRDESRCDDCGLVIRCMI